MTEQPTPLERTLELLWRDRSTPAAPAARTRGRAKRLTVEEVISAGIELADADGLDALSMRRVAERLGVGAMSLYTYVPGKDELIGLMHDQVMLDTARPVLSGGVRERLTQVADSSLADALRHPWTLDVDTSRPWIGPGGSALWEWQLSAVEGSGLTDLEMDQTIGLIGGFVAAAARQIVALRRTRSASPDTDVEWWERTAPILERVMAGQDFPISGRVGAAAGQAYDAATSPEAWYRFGLDRILDGLEVLLASRRTT